MKRELHQSIVEVGTRICANAAELRDEIFRTREALVAAAGRAGLAVAAAGTFIRPIIVVRSGTPRNYRVPPLPRTGVPDHFGSWSEDESYGRHLGDLHCTDDGKKIWWDVRPHPSFGMLEFRVCDVSTRPEAAVMIGALIQAVIVKPCRQRYVGRGQVPAFVIAAARS
jgi:gamma-glutamyl:cysteine ligase YbdK (ATP-grasp superfamily)